MKTVKEKQILVGADFAGFPLKEAVCEHLRKKGWTITDVGVKADSDPDDTDLMFHRVGLRAGAMISEGEFERALLFCGTGMGIHIAASKCPHVHAGVVESVPAALRAITGNGVNVLAMGAFYVAPAMGCDIADAYLNAELGSGYEWWKNFYEFHKLAIDELEAFDYEEYKANNFKVNKLGDFPLKLETKYICADGECDIDFSPMFTYHGFRFASLEVQGEFDGEVELSALSFYTDVDNDSHFYCGNQTMNEIYRSVLRTERCNLHSVASDCPQRDERMAWMNDATVRFMSMPYNFNIARIFEKIADDIANEQGEDGSLTCTAPFVFGERPADPVCSAYLIAVFEHYKHTGDDGLIRKHYDGMAKWNECLKAYAPDGIVSYSYYGDWAGPADCCYSTETIGNSDVLKTEEYDPGAANSLNIQGEMISTAIYYMNLRLMEYFGKVIGKDVKEYTVEKERVQKAYLEKWFDKKNVCIGKNSQSECAVSLYVGILPEEYEAKLAEKMASAVIDAGERITTANIATPMLLDMLTKYGYTDIAWKLISSTEYPSVGYMLANGATTIWERFELKKECGMNSHNHPMYGAMLGWLYRSMAGFKTVVPGKAYKIEPSIPEELKYFEIKIPVLNGSIYLKYENKYGMEVLLVNIPAGLKVTVNFKGKEKEMNDGFNKV